MMVIPADVAIKRFYRCYVRVPENATDGYIEYEARQMIIQEQDAELTLDLDMEIENHDIELIDIDRDGGWEDDEDNE